MTSDEEIGSLRKEVEGMRRRIMRLEKESSDQANLNKLNRYLTRHGRKACFLFGPFELAEAFSKLERDSNWPWREVNRRCNFCGCYLFPAREMERVPTVNTSDVDYEQQTREFLLKAAAEEEFDLEIRERIDRDPEEYSEYYFVRGRKVPFGDYTALYFHAPCFETILRGKMKALDEHARFLRND